MTGSVPAARDAAARHAQRAVGQVAAVSRMIAGGASFDGVAQQLLAARGSRDSLLVRLVELELGDRVAALDVRADVDTLLRAALGHAAPRRLSPDPGNRRAERSTGAIAERTD